MLLFRAKRLLLPRPRHSLFKLSFILVLAFGIVPKISAAPQNPDFVTLRFFSQESPQRIRISAPSGIFLQEEMGESRPLHIETLELDASSGRLLSVPPLATSQEIWRLRGLGTEPLTLTSDQGRVRRLQTELKIAVKSHRLFLTTRIPLEDYVSQVLPEEMPRDFPLEALKAQAVLIRTRTLQKHFEHRREAYDLCDSTHCQVWKGVGTFDAKIQAATQQTQGLILSHGNQAIEALYHSTCGGHTAANHQVFGGKALSYLQGVSDEDFCANSPHSNWKSNLNWAQVQNALGENRLRAINITKQDAYGRVFELHLENSSRAIISAQELILQLGRLYGWETLKSNWWTLSSQKDGLTFLGHGLGHGVGLCQWGARGRAQQGASFEAILRAYFPGTHLQTLTEKTSLGAVR